jgi:hypothetical protein
MKGYARGMTFSATKNWSFLLPALRVDKVTSIFEFLDQHPSGYALI